MNRRRLNLASTVDGGSWFALMKSGIVIAQMALLILAASCSRPPSSYVGTWDPGSETNGSALVPASTRYVLVLRSDGSGEVDIMQSWFRDQTGPLRWKIDGNKLILTEANGATRSLTILEKTETSLKVLQPSSPADTTPGCLVKYTKVRDAKQGGI